MTLWNKARMVCRLRTSSCTPLFTNPIAQEIATLRKEAQAFKRVRTALRSPNSDEEAARLAFEKVCD